MRRLLSLWRGDVSPIGEWDPSYEIGQPDIDSQHRFFVRLIRRLRVTVEQQSVDKDALVPLLHEIKKYAEFHFASEENYMHGVGYPALAEHALIHSMMLSELSARILKARQSWRYTEPLIEFLEEWLQGHIAHEDKKLAAYVLRLHRSGAVMPAFNDSVMAIGG